MNLTKIITLFTDRTTEQLSDQHAAAIRKLCTLKLQENKGFFFKEIPELAEVINLTRQGIEDGKVRQASHFSWNWSMRCSDFLISLKRPSRKTKHLMKLLISSSYPYF